MGVVAPAEERAFLQAFTPLPDGWLVTGDEAATRVLGYNDSGIRVGVIIFPHHEDGAGPVPAAKRASVQRAIERLTLECDLLVGVSDWGMKAEQAYLMQQAPNLRVDVLLGSGPGPGTMGRLTASGGTLWVRAFTDGKAVEVIRFHTLPGPAPRSDFAWTVGADVDPSAIPLDEALPPDVSIAKLFG